MQLDIKKGSKGVIEVFQGDSMEGKQIITLIENDRLLDLTDLICDMAYVDVDNNYADVIGNLNIYNATGGQIELPINANITKRPGVYNCELRLKNKDGNNRYTAFFSLVVKENVFSKAAPFINNSKNFEVLQDLLDKADEYNKELKEATNGLALKYANELNTLDSRMNNFTSLKDGSTTGDAELQDIRVGADGTEYESAGEAVREQIKSIAFENLAIQTYQITDDFAGALIHVPITIKKGQKVILNIKADDGILNNSDIYFGLIDLNDKRIDNIAKAIQNTEIEYVFNTDLKEVLCWLPQDIKKSNGTIKVIVTVIDLFDRISKNEIQTEENTKQLSGGNVNPIIDMYKKIPVKTNTDFNNCIYGSFYANQTIRIQINSNYIVSTAILHIGVGYKSGEVADVLKVNPNKEGKIKLKEDCTYFKIWISKDDISKDEDLNITLKSYSKNGLIEDFNFLEDDYFLFKDSIQKEIIQNTNNNSNFNKILNSDNKENLIDISQKANIFLNRDINYTLSNNFSANQKVRIEINSDSINTIKTIYMGVGYASGEVQNALTLKANQEETFIFKENCTHLRFWIPKENITKDGDMFINVKSYSKNGLIKDVDSLKDDVNSLKADVLKADVLKAKYTSMSILGDSYSTYKGWNPENYAYWYADEGNSTKENNVKGVEQTWWHMLSKETKISILTNSSFSGSTICNTGYSGAYVPSSSFIGRMKNDMGEKQVTLPKPDLILILGGTNDSWANSPLGQAKYSDWSDDDLKSVLPSFAYMLDYLIKYNPHARIINIVNEGLKGEIVQGMGEICSHYNIENLKLKGIDKTGGHPNQNGMKAIKDQIKAIL